MKTLKVIIDFYGMIFDPQIISAMRCTQFKGRIILKSIPQMYFCYRSDCSDTDKYQCKSDDCNVRTVILIRTSFYFTLKPTNLFKHKVNVMLVKIWSSSSELCFECDFVSHFLGLYPFIEAVITSALDKKGCRCTRSFPWTRYIMHKSFLIIL